MIEILIGVAIGLMLGFVIKPRDQSIVDQQAIYDKKLAEYQADIAYYKDLCKWHAERKNEHD
jgi:uncharacterized membrane-anchored protein YhcB (DUF1043 family)